MKALAGLRLTRRGLFRSAPGAAIAAKVAGDQAIRSIVADSAAPVNHLRDIVRDIPNQGPPAGSSQAGSAGVESLIDWRKMRDDAVLKALDSPARRAEVEAILYEQYRYIGRVDYDIAVCRSFSYAAQIAYQRQRMVEQEIRDTVREQTPWQQLQGWKRRVFDVLGIMNRN